jgi:pilus assembly protein Flp/PilA
VNTLLKNKEEGQGLVEYALIIVLIAMIVMVVLLLFGDVLFEAYCDLVEGLNPALNFPPVPAKCGIL